MRLIYIYIYFAELKGNIKTLTLTKNVRKQRNIENLLTQSDAYYYGNKLLVVYDIYVAE